MAEDPITTVSEGYSFNPRITTYAPLVIRCSLNPTYTGRTTGINSNDTEEQAYNHPVEEKQELPYKRSQSRIEIFGKITRDGEPANSRVYRHRFISR